MSGEEFSLDFREVLQQQHSSDVIVTLLTFMRPGDDVPVRLSSDRTEPLDFSGPNALWGTRSRGEIFYWLPLSIVMPGYGEDVVPQFRISVDMIDREILDVLRASNVPADAKVEIVRASDPDFVASQHKGYKLAGAPWNDAATQLVLRQRSWDLEPFPAGTMNPTTFPGLFP
ncbi:hypothetical protein [Methylopila sp. M107]|uniref:hypothetical protein n=1 Tax=Methylopila sp. M107 TaxID=1101190 RepID=UPI00037A13FF|nr:hypothetical protein [Methylopila sp. M107]